MIPRTKIIATVGPASLMPDILQKLVAAGVTIFRLNCSHIAPSDLPKVFKLVRELEAPEPFRTISVFLDLPGPKFRINQPEKPINLKESDELTLKISNNKSAPTSLHLSALPNLTFLQEASKIVLDDGKIVLQVSQLVSDIEVKVTVIKGGEIKSRKGIDFVDATPPVPDITESDLVFLDLAKQLKPDAIAISFVRSAEQVRKIKRMLGQDAPLIISKIERREALDQIEEIVDESDGIMVARGDLALSLPLEKTPKVQRRLIELANDKAKFVIIATQMLSSMVTNPIPTRAEVTDVYHAVSQGADCVMLSDETAVGAHPVEAVSVMNRIIVEASSEFNFDNYKSRLKSLGTTSISDATAYAAAAACFKLGTKALVCCTTSGYSVRLVSRYRPAAPILGFTRSPEVARKINFYWGANSVVVNFAATSDREERDRAFNEIVSKLSLTPGDRVIILGGLKTFKIGSTSILEIRKVD